MRPENKRQDPYALAYKKNPCDIVLKAYEITGIFPEMIIRTALKNVMIPNLIDEKCYHFRLGKGYPRVVKVFAVFLIRKWLKEHPDQLDDREVQ